MASIYVHVPFCRSRCRYCAFYSGEPLDQLDRYVGSVTAEARLRAVGGEVSGPIDTVFFGGGTPTLLGPARLGLLLSHFDHLWGLASHAEISVECNPGSSREFIDLQAAGVTRCSLGVQSLDDATLARLGRTHTAREALVAISSAAASGFTALGADLLYGLAGVVPNRLTREFADLAARGVDHLSAYSVEVHPGTPLAEDPEMLAGPSHEETQWQAILEGSDASGFEPYEVSNFARPGAKCRHNQAYWEGSPYLGLGPGAHGYRPGEGTWGTRTWNTPDLDAYIMSLSRGHLPPGGTEALGRREAILEALFLWLRRPVSLTEAFRAPHLATMVTALAPHLEPLVAQGDLEPPEFTPTLQGMRRADGLSLWLFERLGPHTEAAP